MNPDFHLRERGGNGFSIKGTQVKRAQGDEGSEDQRATFHKENSKKEEKIRRRDLGGGSPSASPKGQERNRIGKRRTQK